MEKPCTSSKEHPIKRHYYSQGVDLASQGSSAAFMSDIPALSHALDDLGFSLSGRLQSSSRSFDSLRLHLPSTRRSSHVSESREQPATPPRRGYDSVESLYREARNLRPLYDNLYDYEAYREDAGNDEFLRRLKAFYRRHKAVFLLIEFLLQFGIFTVALSL